MIYVALLRGINVGGKNKVSMAQLKETFEREGLQDVKTYINSGNIIFKDKSRSQGELVGTLEKAILTDFGFPVNVLIRDIKTMQSTVEALKKEWQNDTAMKCDVLFLWDDIDSKDILTQLTIKPEIDTVVYTPGAILFVVDRKNVTKSGLMKLIGTPIYKRMTIRNCNTTCKLYDLMKALEA